MSSEIFSIEQSSNEIRKLAETFAADLEVLTLICSQAGDFPVPESLSRVNEEIMDTVQITVIDALEFAHALAHEQDPKAGPQYQDEKLSATQLGIGKR